jgi:hypothetical protein
MNELTRKQKSLIFKARTRMLNIKNNCRTHYTNKNTGEQNIICRACKTEDETQSHILTECEIIHPSDNDKIPDDELFDENPQNLRKTAGKLNRIMQKLEKFTD